MDSKTYEKEKVDRIFKMIDPGGFVELFNLELKIACKKREKCTQMDAFNRLNDEYFAFTGKYRYNSFQSFKKVLYTY